MTGWTRHEGTALALDLENVDTDQLIPARFMSTPRAEGYGNFLLHDLRHDADGTPTEDFHLNRHPDATVLVARRNFGSGSSREAAVYALVDFGFRAVIAPSFGDIFASNAVNNGLLPARIGEDAADALIRRLDGTTASASIDLAAGTVTVADQTVPFDLTPAWQEKLVNGWDDIDLTQKHAAEMQAFRTRRAAEQPWAVPHD